MNELTQEQKVNLYMWCLDQGVSLEYGKLSLCDLKNFRHSNIRDDRRYQVHCEDVRYPWSMIYEDMHAAVIKFLELKGRTKRIR
jgi:hypothetical protein